MAQVYDARVQSTGVKSDRPHRAARPAPRSDRASATARAALCSQPWLSANTQPLPLPPALCLRCPAHPRTALESQLSQTVPLPPLSRLAPARRPTEEDLNPRHTPVPACSPGPYTPLRRRMAPFHKPRTTASRTSHTASTPTSASRPEVEMRDRVSYPLSPLRTSPSTPIDAPWDDS